jgi:hypothetical protein
MFKLFLNKKLTVFQTPKSNPLKPIVKMPVSPNTKLLKPQIEKYKNILFERL